MKSLVLHIGYPKTGTSSLQWFLHANRECLEQQGIYYPITGQGADHAHHRLAFSLADNAYEQWDEQPRTRLFEELSAEIDSTDANTIVLSSEIFVGIIERILSPKHFENLLQGRSVRVICFLRHQGTFLESLYRQLVWDSTVRFSGDPFAFLNAFPDVGDYHAALSRWAAVVGKDNVVPVVYEQALKTDGCLKRFCHLLGVDTDKLSHRDFDARRNVALAPNVATDIVRAANGYAHLSSEQRVDLARSVRQFVDTTANLPLPRQLFTADHVAHVESRYLESNLKLAAEFVHQPLDGFWFREEADAGSSMAPSIRTSAS